MSPRFLLCSERQRAHLREREIHPICSAQILLRRQLLDRIQAIRSTDSSSSRQQLGYQQFALRGSAILGRQDTKEYRMGLEQIA
jgi:hypothetical protein